MMYLLYLVLVLHRWHL